ncbi:solute carrier family 25 member 42 [Diaporthe eres]|nr:solute carrier family 25 member 42 [Diaporthe eres]
MPDFGFVGQNDAPPQAVAYDKLGLRLNGAPSCPLALELSRELILTYGLRKSESDHLRLFISQPVVAEFCTGGVTGPVSRTAVSPLERLKILFQIQSAAREEYELSVGNALKEDLGHEQLYCSDVAGPQKKKTRRPERLKQLSVPLPNGTNMCSGGDGPSGPEHVVWRLDATLDEASVQRGTHHDHGWCQAPSENNLGVRLGRVTAVWRARVDATAEEPEDESRTRRAVADWAVAATAVANKLTDPHDARPIYVV